MHEFLSLLTHLFFFFNHTATTEIYTLSLHDALPICGVARHRDQIRVETRVDRADRVLPAHQLGRPSGDRKSTRLNSSHGYISYAVFCLKKKKKKHKTITLQHTTLNQWKNSL